jgi:uncharacterized protein YcfJ
MRTDQRSRQRSRISAAKTGSARFAASVGILLGGLSALSSAMAGTPMNSSTVQARVLTATPVVAQVAVPRQACFDELQTVHAQPSGAGALLGAVAGAAVGNAIGQGSGNAVATGVGLIGGAILGSHIETRGRPVQTQTVRRCEQQTAYENQVVAYDVTYEINGQRYSTQMDRQPGATIPVQVSVSPVAQTTTVSRVVSTPVVYAPAVQRVSYVQPAVALSIPVYSRHYTPVRYVKDRRDDRHDRHDNRRGGHHDHWR